MFVQTLIKIRPTCN